MTIDIWLETDLEPDDILAMYVLAIKGYRFKYIVIGEGNIDKKYKRICTYMDQLIELNLANNDYTVIFGEGNINQFMYLKEGDEFGYNGILVDNQADIDNISKIYQNRLNDFISNGGTEFICLKPPKELLKYYSHIKKDIQKLNAYIYGESNFNKIYDKTLLLTVLSQFNKVVIYESFHATNDISLMNIDTCPNTWSLIHNLDNNYLNSFIRLIILWNTYISEDSVKICDNILNTYDHWDITHETFIHMDIAEIKLELTNISFSEEDSSIFINNFINMKDYLNTNRVDQTIQLADIGLAMCIGLPLFNKYLVQGDLSFNTTDKHSIFSPNCKSNLFLYKSIPIELYDAQLSNIIKIPKIVKSNIYRYVSITGVFIFGGLLCYKYLK
jgi:hypothetical protein